MATAEEEVRLSHYVFEWFIKRCRHCHKSRSAHVNGISCLFSSTSFSNDETEEGYYERQIEEQKARW